MIERMNRKNMNMTQSISLQLCRSVLVRLLLLL